MAESDSANISPEDWPCVEARLRRQTHRLVRRHKAKILKLAEILLTKGKMEGAEADLIAFPGKHFF